MNRLYNKTRFVDSEFVTIELPGGFDLRTEASNDSLYSEFGVFSSQLKLTSGRQLVWQSRFESHAREVPLQKYEDYHNFMNEVTKRASQYVVLQKHKGAQ